MFRILKYCRSQKQTFFGSGIINRHYMKVSNKLESLLKRKDKIPKKYELIYRHEGTGVTTSMYHFLTIITVGSVGALTYAVYFKDPDPDLPIEYQKVKDNPRSLHYSMVVAAIIVFATIRIRHRFVIRIYNDEQAKMYKSIFIGNMPFTTECYSFPHNSVVLLSEHSILPWKNSLFSANGRKIYLYDSYFKSYGHFQNVTKMNLN